MSQKAGNQVLTELEEFARFSAAEQRYIRRSLEVAHTRAEAAEHWARGIHEAADIGLQARTYDLIDEIRALVPENVEPDDTTLLLPLLIRISAFDLHHGKLTSFAAYRFLYERLLGAAVRPWLLSAFAAAAGMPSVHPELRAELLRSLTSEQVASAGWRGREAAFFPEWVEKIPAATI